jgi:hypothetical protein
MDNEKKIKLDELPDKGSETGEEDKPKIIPLKKTSIEPRLEKLKGLEDEERLEILSRSWRFDRPVRYWGGIILFLLLAALQFTKALPTIGKVEGLSGMFLPQAELDFVLSNPIIFAILLPFFFKLRKESEHYFELTFSGIKTVQNVFPPPRQVVIRITVHWDEIAEVEKVKIKGRTILMLNNSEGPIGEMIWDIAGIKKEVIKNVMREIVNKKHPMMVFLEKDIV